MTDNPYDILGVPTEATPEDIKKQYRDKARRAHPDHGGDEKDMTALSIAYSVLSDPKKRAHFDNTGKIRDTMRLNKEAVDQITKRLQEMMALHGPDIVKVDIIDSMTRRFSHDMSIEKEKIEDSKKQADFWFKMAHRFHRKSEDAPPIFESMMENSGRAQEAIQDLAKENIEILEEAKRILKEYEFLKDKEEYYTPTGMPSLFGATSCDYSSIMGGTV